MKVGVKLCEERCFCGCLLSDIFLSKSQCANHGPLAHCHLLLTGSMNICALKVAICIEAQMPMHLCVQ